MIKVLIADDQQLIRESLKIVLQQTETIEVTDSVGNGYQVIQSVKEKKPDVILMDIRMPNLDGVQCTRQIKEQYPQIKIIILTTFDDDEYVYDALRYGASGYLLKGVSMDELINAIRIVHEGQAMINPDIQAKVVRLFSELANLGENISQSIIIDKADVSTLSSSDWKVIREVEKGLSNKEIAEKLFLSEGTVRNYISNILTKLELRDRTQLAIWAIENKLLKPKP
ncbi:MAG: response regulator transcription factor [Spirochaetia bacterium]|jgi:DNA-binding NarL/FixJ family response regulator|nr:response regulator transcription factor [Spirochaetia bacterium]